ncbi:MAG TPA: hypothetical protein P5328_00300 [Candidatus Paceibacterota bacterium]|nr:hypothetical protein [Candidatus Paceibacterota bacterium]HRZ34232.1 hypothetical protein [Candidatus Paceibacterota bacterium]
MLLSKNRISAGDLQEIFKSVSNSVSSKFFYLKKRLNNLNYSRFAVIIPQKISKLSVARHRNKRKVMNLLKKIGTTGNYDYVLTLKKRVDDVVTGELEADLVKILI